MQSAPGTLLGLIRQRFMHELEDAAIEYLSRPPDEDLLTLIPPRREPIHLHSLGVRSIRNLSFIEDFVSMDIVLACKTNQNDVDIIASCFLMSLRFTPRLIISSVEPASESPSEGESMDLGSSLLPNIDPTQYDEEATRFLRLYYPQALKDPIPLPIETIVTDKLGLRLILGKRLTADFSIFGQICFTPGRVAVYDAATNAPQDLEVDAGTILVDENTFYLRNDGCARFTIAHEAFHWHKHRHFAYLQGLLDNESFLTRRCPVHLSRAQDNKGSVLEIVEDQANRIAPRILMPKETVTFVIEALIEQCPYSRDGRLKPADQQWIAERLAMHYNVSKQTAKNRIAELGYFKYHNYTSTKAVFIKSVDPYRILEIDAFDEYSTNPDFRAVLDTKKFIYVDPYIVIRNPKYVQGMPNLSSLSLTPYARAHLEECALRFDDRSSTIPGSLPRKNAPHPRAFNLQNNVQVADTAEQMKELVELYEERLRLEADVTVTFHQLLNHYIKMKKWNSSQFVERTSISPATFSKLKNEEHIPSLNTIMLISYGLGLDSDQAEHLANLAGFTIKGTPIYFAYSFILSFYPGRSIQDCNEFLRRINARPLSTGKL